MNRLHVNFLIFFLSILSPLLASDTSVSLGHHLRGVLPSREEQKRVLVRSLGIIGHRTTALGRRIEALQVASAKATLEEGKPYIRTLSKHRKRFMNIFMTFVDHDGAKDIDDD